MLSGRYADVLSGLFLGYSTLWYTSHQKGVDGLDKLTDFAMQVCVTFLLLFLTVSCWALAPFCFYVYFCFSSVFHTQL